MEEEKLIIIKVRKKEWQMIRFWRHLKFGKIEVIIHGAIPQKIIKSEGEIILNGNVKGRTEINK